MIPIPFPIPKLQLNALALKLIIGIGCLALLALLIHDRNRWKAKTAEHAERLAAERGAHSATVTNYRAAAERAHLSDAANAARVRAEQSAINQRSKHDYESRIAAARAAAQRLRTNPGAAADPGGGGGEAMPRLSAAAGGAAQAAGENRLPDAGQRAARDRGALGPANALIATEQAIQLDELIEWVRLQHAVSVNGAQPTEARVD